LLCNFVEYIQNYFDILSNRSLFNPTIPAHQIAIYAIYMPMLRKDLHGFVQDWNVHNIRKQPNKPHSVSGKPNILYHQHPGVSDYCKKPRVELVQELLQDVDGFELDEYLPATTLDWCHDILANANFPHPTALNWEPHRDMEYRTHYNAYLYLRDAAVAYQVSGIEPRLSLSSLPRGALEWQPNPAITRAQSYRGIAADLDGRVLICDEAAV
jgi:hypothetical protein